MTTTAAAMAEMEYVTAKTSVWWDIENCGVPRGHDSYAIAQNVSSSLLKMKYCGPVSITAYGDTALIPLHVQQALSSTGVWLNHVPAGIKDASDKKILVDMLLWAIDNPAPANFMLISGDRDFSYALHQLRMRRYNILLAQPPQASVPLVAAARNSWLWTSLASGGPPLTSVESSRLLNNGRCQLSSYEQAQSSKPIDSTAGAKDTKDHKTRENHVSSGLPQETRRNKPQNGRGGVLREFVDSRGTQVSIAAKPIQEAELVECKVCQIFCSDKDAYKKHTYGKRHQNNLELQLGKSKNISAGPVVLPKDVLEKQKMKVNENRANPKANYACRLCNVVCPNQFSFDSHLRGKKHASMLSQPEAIIDSKKWQEIGVSQNDQPKETIVCQKEQLKEKIAEPKATAEHICRLCNVTCPSQIVFDSHLRGQKHAAMLSQSEALNNSRKLEENVVVEKAQSTETVAENQLQSQTTQENTKFFETQNEEFRGTSESSIKELCLSTKDRVETVNKQLPNGEFFLGDLRCDTEVPREARESFDGIVKPVNLSEGATEHLEEVKVRRRASGLCYLCVVICDHQGLSTVVCGNKCHWTNQKHTTASASVAINDSQSSVSTKPIKEPEVLEPVWCQVCEIGCISKDAYKSHTYGKRHRNNLDLQSDKSDNISVGPDVLPKDVLEKQKMKVNENRANYACRLCNVVCPNQFAFDSHLRGKKHASMLSQPEALIDSKKPQEEGVCQKDQLKETIVSQKEQLKEKIAEPKPNAEHVCRLCNVEFPSQIVFDSHIRGQHAAMLSQSELDQALIDSKKLQEKSVGEEDQTRETFAVPKPKAEHVCRMCNVACQSPIVFASHLRGKKHVAMLSQSNALIDSRKLQEKGVEEKEQPRKTIAHLQLESQNAQKNSKCFEKHVVMVNQSEALNNSMKLEEKVVKEKAEPIETAAENQSQSQNTQENINFFEKQNEEFREICGTSERSIKELFPHTNDQVDTVNKQLPNGELVFGDVRCDLEVPREASECFDGIPKPLNTSKGAMVHSGEMNKKQKEVMVGKTGPAAFDLCDRQGFSMVCDKKVHWTNQKHTMVASSVAFDASQSSVSTNPIKESEVLQPVWCQVCEISCISKDAYKNHTYGKKHRQQLELQSVLARIPKENAEKKEMKNVVCHNQTFFDFPMKSQNHPVMVKGHAEELVESRRIQQESYKEIEKSKEQALEKIQRAFTELKRESLVNNESRHPLDVKMTDKLEDEPKDNLKPKPREPENKSVGSKENPGETEGNKVQADNFWTRLWGKRS